MSDFVSNFWASFVAIATLVSILACAVLLWISSSTKVNPTADNTTGHVWDGDLREMNNPLPKWWVYLFIITVIFALVYGVLYPQFGSFQGKLGWSSTGQHAVEVKAMEDRIAPVYAEYAKKDAAALAADPKAMAIGERLFMNYCSQCHGSDARGAKGFPNLTDNDWLWGGTPEAVKEAITNGRNGVMPPMAAAVGTPEDVANVAQFVLSLSGSPHDAVKATSGKEKFGACAACHGADGKGNIAMGAPNLTDGIWLHGWGADAIIKMINEGKNNAMPGQARLLNEAQIHVLASYVLSKSAKAGN